MDHKFIILNVYGIANLIFKFSYHWKCLCIMELKLDMYWFQVHHPLWIREYFGIIEMICCPFKFILDECHDFVIKSSVFDLACWSYGYCNWHKSISWYLIYWSLVNLSMFKYSINLSFECNLLSLYNDSNLSNQN